MGEKRKIVECHPHKDGGQGKENRLIRVLRGVYSVHDEK